LPIGNVIIKNPNFFIALVAKHSQIEKIKSITKKGVNISNKKSRFSTTPLIVVIVVLPSITISPPSSSSSGLSSEEEIFPVYLV